MLSLSILALVAGAATVALAVSIGEDGHYDTRYNHLDIERILNNKRLVTYYGQCLIGDGPCTPQGTEFKRILPEALRTNCARCTEKQKVTAYLAIRRLKKEYPKIWQQLQVAWDPKGEYVSTFINTVESSKTPDAGAKPEPAPGASQTVVGGRFGGDAAADNEIATGTDTFTVPLTKEMPSSTTVSSLSSSTTTTTTTTTTTAATTTISARASVPATVTNYRTSFRPTRFNILLPRPQDFGRLTVNWIGSIGDIGTKVIRTGARIADMVLSGVQAGVQATIGRTLP